MTTKQTFITAIQDLPEDASVDDILETIYVVLKIERGLAAGAAGDKVSLEQARQEAKSWSAK